MAKKSGRRGAGGAAGSVAPPSELDQLRLELARSLRCSVDETVDAVCGQFEHTMSAYARRVATGLAAMDPLTDYDMYYSCCQRLTKYIAANMETSPGFAQQMDRIILACHSNASEQVLRSVVTKDLWFHRRDGGTRAGGHEDDTDSDEPTKREKRVRTPSPRGRSPATRSAAKRGVVTRSAEKRGIATRSAEKRGITTRSGSRHVSPPPKRPRRSARRIVDESDSDDGQDEDIEERELEEEEKEEEEEEGEEEEVVEEESQPRRGKRGRGATKSQPHYEQEDELLTFKDTIGELCYPDQRTPQQTKFFKDRLRKAIQFVDAQLCKPPPGQYCSRDCKKLRSVMCNSTKPCKNKQCRVWHDVEVHTDQCVNTNCEFKNRILLRETMHKIDHQKQELQQKRSELQAKNKQLTSTKRGATNDREQFIETTLLENEIKQLEVDVTEGDEELKRLNATRKAFWGVLNEIGIKLSDDVVDNFPDYATHYTTRRAAHKSTTPQKSKATASAAPRTPPNRRSERTVRTRGSGPHDEHDDTPNGTERSTRATRRSTRGVVGDDAANEDEETKDEDHDADHSYEIAYDEAHEEHEGEYEEPHDDHTAEYEAPEGEHDVASEDQTGEHHVITDGQEGEHHDEAAGDHAGHYEGESEPHPADGGEEPAEDRPGIAYAAGYSFVVRDPPTEVPAEPDNASAQGNESNERYSGMPLQNGEPVYP